MTVHFYIVLLRWATLGLALLFLIGKIWYTANAKAKFSGLPIRAIGWFSHMEVYGTTSEFKRQYMKQSNFINTAIILSAIVCVALYMLPE